MTDPPRRNVTSAGRIYFGLTVTSARSWSFRAISTGSPVSTSLAASRNASCCADRISLSDDVNGQLLPAQQAGDTVPAARRALVGVHRPTLHQHRAGRQCGQK